MHPTTNTLSENIRAQSIALLNEHLAAAIDLHGQVKQTAPEPAPVPTASLPLSPKDPSVLETEVDSWVDEGGAGGEVNRARDATSTSPSARNRHAGKPKPKSK